MPWQCRAMKDGEASEKPRGGGNQPMIRGCPNGETRSDDESEHSNLALESVPGEVKHLSSRRKRKRN